ncbi:hypothetical protein [Mesorhizobium amorphae]
MRKMAACGQETPEKLLGRHRRYLEKAVAGEARMFRISHDGLGAGSIGYWKRMWRGDLVYETGWAVVPGLQGARDRRQGDGPADQCAVW